MVNVQGYSEAQIEVVMGGQKEAMLWDTHGLSYARILAEDFPDTRIRQCCPPSLPKELVWALRISAARLFQARRTPHDMQKCSLSQ